MFDRDQEERASFQRYVQVVVDDFAALVPKIQSLEGVDAIRKLDGGDFRATLEEILVDYDREDLEIPPILKRDIALIVFDYYDKRNQWREWVKIGEIALRACEEIQDELSIVRLLINMGITHRMLGRISEAFGFFQQALERVVRPQEKADILTGMSDIYRLWGDMDRAILYGQEARDIAESINDGDRIAKALEFLGLAFMGCLDYDKAIECYERALSRRQEQGNLRWEAMDFSHLALALSHRGREEDLKLAVYYYSRARKIETEFEDKQRLGGLSGDIAVAYNKLGKYHEAIQLSEEALEFNEEVDYYRGATLNKARLSISYLGLAIDYAMNVCDNYHHLSAFDRVHLQEFKQVVVILVNFLESVGRIEEAKRLKRLLTERLL